MLQRFIACVSSVAGLRHVSRAGSLHGVALVASVAFGSGCSGQTLEENSVEATANAEGLTEASWPSARLPGSSGPIALSADGSLVWAVNQGTNSVSVIRTDTNAVVAHVKVGENPRSVALDPDNKFAYVANANSNDVSVIDIRRLLRGGLTTDAVERRITTGAGPSGVLVSPNGDRVFVANSGQDTLVVLDGRNQRALGSIDLRNSACNVDDDSRHFQPRGLAITGNGKRLYVTRFISYTRPGGAQRADYGKEGLVCRVDFTDGYGLRPTLTPIRLAASDTGFLDRAGNATGAFPNQLQSIVIRGDHAYLPNIAASPTAPLRFDADTQAYVNRIDGISQQETDAGALNLHLGARDPEPGKPELYFANPWAMAFTNQVGKGSAYVVSAASDLLVKLDVDSAGELHFTTDSDTTRYIDLNNPDDPATSGANAGKNPIGIVVNSRGTKAYVLNNVSRNVSVVDLSQDLVERVISTDALPEPGSTAELVLVGAELFASSRGNFVHPEGVPGSTRNRLSEKGHQACTSCHADGLTDGVIWQFNSGPRKTISINGTTNPKDRTKQRIINYSAIFDELEDVDFNTRGTSSAGPLPTPLPCIDWVPPSGLTVSTNDPNHGLILGSEQDYSKASCVLVPFAVPNENRPQLRVQLPGSSVQVKATDALKEWQRQAISTPNRPMSARELAAAGLANRLTETARVDAGRQLFLDSGCATCHGGAQWTSAVKDFVSPPAASEVATETTPGVNPAPYLYRFLHDVGTFDLNVAGSDNLLPGFPVIGGVETDGLERQALGFDYDGDGKGNGFNSPSLLGTFAVPPYFHNGACETLLCVLSSVKHRRAGLPAGAPDPLDSSRKRAELAAYLETIDLQTPAQGVESSSATAANP